MVLTQLFLKQLFDRTVAAIALIVLSPVFLVLCVLCAFSMGMPIFFSQPRPGKDGVVFQFYKFRSMTSACDAQGNLLPDVERMTPYGRFLRSTSLDELPQLLNVLKGDMSFIGPRPLLVRYLPRYSATQARRHNVKPGITGLAQVSGRNSIDWDRKFELDVWYVDNWSLWLDLKILFLTVAKVLKREGISQSQTVTMNEFLGAQASKN